MTPAIFAFRQKAKIGNKEKKEKNLEEYSNNFTKYSCYDRYFFEEMNEILLRVNENKIVFLIDDDVEFIFQNSLNKILVGKSCFMKMKKITEMNMKKFLKFFFSDENKIDQLTCKAKGNLFLLENHVVGCKIRGLDLYPKGKKAKKGALAKKYEKVEMEDENTFSFFHLIGKFCYNKSIFNLYKRN